MERKVRLTVGDIGSLIIACAIFGLILGVCFPDAGYCAVGPDSADGLAGLPRTLGPSLEGTEGATLRQEIEDIGVTTGGYSTEQEPQPIVDPHPAIPTPAPKVEPKPEAPKTKQVVDSNSGEVAKKPKKIGFFAKFSSENIETYHPKINKGWNVYMFMYDHGGKQTADLGSKAAMIALAFMGG